MNNQVSLCFYILILFGGSFLVWGATKLHNKTASYCTGMMIAVLIGVISAFRGSTGTDSDIYRRAYEYGENAILHWTEYEPGYQAWVSLLKEHSFSYRMLFGSMGFLTSLFIVLTIIREKDKINPFIASFIFFSDLFMMSMNIIRQAMAMSVCIFAMTLFFAGKSYSTYPYPLNLLDDKNKPPNEMFKRQCIAIILILIASQFHKSALICLAIVIGKTVFTQKNIPILLISFFCIFSILLFNRDILYSIVYFLTRSHYYASYFNSTVSSGGSFGGYYIQNLPIIAISALYYGQYKKDPKQFQLFTFMMIGVLFSSIGVITNSQVNRIGFYFKYLDIIVIAYCANQPLKNKIFRIKVNKSMITLLVLLYYMTAFIYKVYIAGFNELIPYGK